MYCLPLLVRALVAFTILRSFIGALYLLTDDLRVRCSPEVRTNMHARGRIRRGMTEQGSKIRRPQEVRLTSLWSRRLLFMAASPICTNHTLTIQIWDRCPKTDISSGFPTMPRSL